MKRKQSWARVFYPVLLLLVVAMLFMREPRHEWVQASDDAPAPATKAAVVGAQP